MSRPALGAAICGSLYGLGLARFIFESQPQRFQLFGDWPGVLGMAVVCGGVLVVLARRLHAQITARPFASIGLLLPLVSTLAPDVNLLRAQTLLLGAPILFLLLAFIA